MIKIDIYSNDFIDILCPFNIESLWDIIAKIKDERPKIKYEPLKKNVLNIVAYLLDEKLIFLIDHITNDKKFIKSDLSNQEVMKMIDIKWESNIEFGELYTLAWFKFEDWYRNALVKKGLTYTTNWKNFVKNEIGDLKEWININKP